MNVQGARQRAAVARGFGPGVQVVTRRVVVEVPVPSVLQEAERQRLENANAALVRERDEWRAKCSRLQMRLGLVGVAS